MAAPGVSGGLALLYQRYRQLNAGADPANALMKAVLLNGADDKGNAGIDYKYGFGWINLLRSVRMIEQQNYFTGSVNQGGFQTYNLTIAPGTSISSLKVMLYWNDSAAAAGLIVSHPGKTMPKPLSILTKYSDRDMATTILETAYSRISAQPIIHANNSPNATYAYV